MQWIFSFHAKTATSPAYQYNCDDMPWGAVGIFLPCQSSNKPSIPTRYSLLQGFSLRLQQDQDQSDRLSTLIDISFELVLPYSDLRPENPGQLTISDTFWLLTGETPSTLKLGRRVQATITGLSGQAAYCSLPDLNDMEAVILAGSYSSFPGPPSSAAGHAQTGFGQNSFAHTVQAGVKRYI